MIQGHTKPCLSCRWLLDRPERRIEACPNAPQRKADLRREIVAALATMTPEVRRRKSQLIARKLLALPEFQQAGLLMTYVALPMEVDPWAATRQAWLDGKAVAVPRIDPPLSDRSVPFVHDRRILPAELRGQAVEQPEQHSELVAEAFGVMEPGPTATILPLAEIGLVLVPCIAYDRQGYRMGKGGGFYDRFLSQPACRAVSVGLAFTEQVFASLPRCPYDQPVDVLITETEIIDFRKKG